MWLRVVLARLACRLVDTKAWERLAFARLSDYAAECLGVSARSVRSLAEVGRKLSASPRLENTLVSGTLGWTKVRLLARLPREEDDAPWIDYAGRVTAEQLSQAVRAVDRGSVEAGAVGDTEGRGRAFEIRCTPEVRRKWYGTRGAARRAAGRMLHPAEAAELIAAEVLSALPLHEDADQGSCGAGTSWSEETERDETTAREDGSDASCGRDVPPPEPPPGPPWRSGSAGDGSAVSPPRLPRPSLPAGLEPFLEGLEEADAFAVDERLRRALSLEQRLEARIGPLLTLAWQCRAHRALRYTTRDAYVRERLGMDPSRARSLVRLERTAADSPAFDHAYRTGTLSWVRASTLVPLVSADPLGGFIGDWVDWAGRVTVRRLREDVEKALVLKDTDREAFDASGGLPPEARNREIGAPAKGREAAVPKADREIGAPAKGSEEDVFPHKHPEPLKRAPGETCWVRFIGPSAVVRLFNAVLCTVRRRMGQHDGRLPTEGEALDAMLDHALVSWGARDEKVARRHRVFARDGWRCAAPGCTSMENLHDHHIRYRSAQGSDDLENRITLCAFHHLRGVHAGILRCVGRAPDELRWEMGIRPGVPPRLRYRSGDIRVSSGTDGAPLRLGRKPGPQRAVRSPAGRADRASVATAP